MDVPSLGPRFGAGLLACFAMLPFAQTQSPIPSGGTEGRDLVLQRLTAPADPPLVAPRGYALVIGVGRYQNVPREQWLRFSESDAEAMYRSLISQRGGAFPAENVHKLIGREATLANVRKELEGWLPSVAGPEDRVVVYFSGHGLTKSGAGYLAPYDLDLKDIPGSGLSMREFGDVLATRVRARWKAAFVDACHSGKITPESSHAEIDRAISALPDGFLTFAAAREREQSFEDARLSTGFGLFTYFLVQGLSGHADNPPCDGVITADELIDYVRTEVQRYGREHGLAQTPTEHGDFDNRMVFGANPVCTPSRGAPSGVGGILIEATDGSVDVYIDGALIGPVSSGTPVEVPGLSQGVHTVKGVRNGYEPETREVMVVPGQQRTITLRVQYRREYQRHAVELLDRGEDLLFKRNSSVNPSRIYSNGKQRPIDLRRAKTIFSEALMEDPSLAKAAHDLGIACQQLSEYPAMMDAFRRAIAADPSYAEVRIDYAGALIEEGDPDEAIRQLLEAIRLEPSNDLARSHLARAYLDKEAWKPAIASAAEAIALNADNPEAFLWKADAYRRRASGDRAGERRATLESAREAFAAYVRLTTFRVRVDEIVAFYAIGFHVGSRTHSDRQSSYANQRSMALMGLCDVERQLGNLQQAVTHCEQAVKYDSNEPLAYFFLGNAYRDLYNITLRRDHVILARKNYARMVQLNSDLPLSRHARDYMEQIDSRMAIR